MKRGLVLLLALDCSVASVRAEPPSSLSLVLALKSTLERHPLLQVEQLQVEISRAAQLQASAQFDLVFQSDFGHSRVYRSFTDVEQAVFGASGTTTNTTDLTLRATQRLRNGMTADSTMSVNRSADPLAAPLGLNQSNLAFTVTVPLLRGRGRDVVTAPETAAGMGVEASVFDVAQSRSDLLANTAAAYWGAVAAKRTYGVYVDAEERGRVYLDTVQTLIDADKLPRSEISQVRANLASRAATRLAAQQQLLQAKQQLGVAMGLRGDEMLTVPDPSDSLPTEATHLVSTIDRGALTPWIDLALVRRADLLALKKRQSAATVLRAAAQNQLRAQLDMQVSTGYSGLGEGTGADRYFASPFVGVRGADVVGNIHYELPVGRRAAQGSFMEADSVVRQTERRIDEAARTITSDVIVAADAVRRAAERLQQSQLSVEYSRAALDNEREKLRLGVGSLIDVLTVEERLTNVLVFQVQSELAFAVSIAQLRRATGTIVAADKIVPDVDASVFLTLPASEPSRQ